MPCETGADPKAGPLPLERIIIFLIGLTRFYTLDSLHSASSVEIPYARYAICDLLTRELPFALLHLSGPDLMGLPILPPLAFSYQVRLQTCPILDLQFRPVTICFHVRSHTFTSSSGP